MLFRLYCKTDYYLISNPGISRREKQHLWQYKNIQKTLLEGVWSSVGFLQFIGKQTILADHLLLAHEKFKYPDRHQRFNWKQKNPFALERLL